MLQTAPIDAVSQTERACEISDRLQTALSTYLRQACAPDHRRIRRLVSATETVELLGVTGQFLHKCHSDGILPEPKERRDGRRFYSGDELSTMRTRLEESARIPGKYLPGRWGEEWLLGIQLMNFKGGSAKSTTAIHLCHDLALNGYRNIAWC